MGIRFFLLFCMIMVAVLAHAGHDHPNGGQKESTDHGAQSPHEKRHSKEDHFKDGKHNAEFDHEAILGSRKVADEFDMLPPEESKRRLKVLAAKWDKNGDSFIDRKEMMDWIEHSLKQLDQEEINERFAEVDLNKDGKIDFNEYQKDAFGDEDRDEHGNLKLDEDDMHLLKEDKRYFDAADQDKDGVLSKDEFAAFQNPEAFDHMFPALVQTTLEDKDKDGDGAISLEEFLGDIKNQEKDWVVVEKDRFEHDYDKNKDGKLDKDEMRGWLVPDIKQNAKDETNHLFENADKNKDNLLSIDEIVDQHDLFVGSEATNYGDHLENMKHTEL